MKILLMILLLFGFFIVHAVKMMRLYLILLDRQIPFARFVPAYFRTTLVNLIVPFKLGEVYRVCEFWRLSGGFNTGFFSVLVDRFFDTFAIVLILLPYQMIVSGRVTLPVILLSVFLVVIVFAYVIFPSTYRFLNRYIIMTRSSQKSMAVLKGLEVVNEWYEYVQNLISGRYGILILFSLLAWIAELFVITGFAKLGGKSFSIGDFGTYIESIISGKTDAITWQYNIIGAAIILIAAVVFTILYLLSSRKGAKGND